MNYRRYIDHANTTFSVNDHLVECGSTTWQIRNIAATSVGRRVLLNKEPEPIFTQPEPKLSLPWRWMLGLSLGSAVVVNVLFRSNALAWLVFLGCLVAFVVSATRRKDQLILQWQEARAKVQRQWAIWDEMRRNPPVLFSLKLETNAGSRSLFYAWDEDVIVKARDAISDAMSKKELGTVTYNFDTVNVGAEDAINNFGSHIYQQTIAEATNGIGHQ